VSLISRKKAVRNLLLILLLSGLFVQTTHVLTHLGSLLPAAQPSTLRESTATADTQAFSEHDCSVCETLAHLTAETSVTVSLSWAEFASETFRTRITPLASITSYSFAGRAPPVA
jgi:hypothetical protein